MFKYIDDCTVANLVSKFGDSTVANLMTKICSLCLEFEFFFCD